MTKLKSGCLGDHKIHQVATCPPTVQKEITEREMSDQKFQPWPMTVNHMLLSRVFYNYEAVSYSTRFTPDSRSGNVSMNIVEVMFLTNPSAVL